MDEQSKLHSKAKKGEFLFRGLPATAFIEKSHASTGSIELLVLSIFYQLLSECIINILFLVIMYPMLGFMLIFSSTPTLIGCDVGCI